MHPLPFNRLRRSGFFCLLVIGVLMPAVAAANSPKPPINVLVLHSYHPGYAWTDRVMAGIQEGFGTSDQHIRLHVEYLDTKRHSNPDYFSNILDAILHYKLEDRSFDLVLLTHNEALNFALQHRNDLFADTPLVFCATTGFDPEMVTNLGGLYGVTEQPDFAGTLRLALRLDRKLEKIVVIGSTRDVSGRVEQRLMQQAAKGLDHRVRVVFWNDLPTDQLIARLKSLRREAAVVLLGTVFDRGGNLLSEDETASLVRDNTAAALYSLWTPYLGQGIVGGRLVNLKDQGWHAALLALQVLNDSVAETSSVQVLPPDPPVFDHRELQRLGFSQGLLPPESALVFQPPSFYRLSKQEGLILFGLFAGSLTISGILGRNILRRRKAEARLRDSEQSYRQLSQQFEVILDGIPDGVTLVSTDMKVVWSNKGAGGYAGRVPGSGIPGEFCCKVLYNRVDLCENCPALETFRTGRGAEANITTPDGRLLEVKAFALRDHRQMVTHAILLASDVTEKEKLREEAERASRLASLGELAAGIAHEINNPNALILLNASLVQKACRDAAPILHQRFQATGDFNLGGLPFSEMSKELPHLFSELMEGAERIRRIVTDLKDFARPETSDMSTRVDLNDVVITAIRLISNAIKQSTNHLQADYQTDLPRIRGNFQKLEQVVVNLLLNACQALPDRDKGLMVETGFDPFRKQVWLRIGDEGVGIAAEDLRHITDPFFTTKRDRGGTGLGLSVSTRIIKDHQGDLEFSSTPGIGTVALLRLPAAQPSEEVHFEPVETTVAVAAYSAG